ncbi:tail assembly protein [Acinetobacter sp. 2JN-4]|uniref:tail assembly protein n=1 Tax=Acinetobacter sp. 2JN-4 TaxID=2479844 RepID=UPI000EF9D6A7|nr:tail assembly protein [Acinetobacter sp. 2JN-4]RLZ06577.1 tail assembly protein [Acinetobacter sp. 2JN-4]
MLKTIKLYGVLAQKFGRQFKLDVASPREAIRALSAQIEGFEHFMLGAHERGLAFAIFTDTKVITPKRGKKKATCFDTATGRMITGHNIGESELDMRTDSTEIKIVPRVIGAGGDSGVLQLVLGVVLIVAGFWTGGATSNMGIALIGAGAGMVVGGIAQMLMPKVDPNIGQNQDGNRANFGFGGAVTTIAQGNPVPVLRGKREIGGFIVSAGQYPEDMM